MVAGASLAAWVVPRAPEAWLDALVDGAAAVTLLAGVAFAWSMRAGGPAQPAPGWRRGPGDGSRGGVAGAAVWCAVASGAFGLSWGTLQACWTTAEDPLPRVPQEKQLVEVVALVASDPVVHRSGSRFDSDRVSARFALLGVVGRDGVEASGGGEFRASWPGVESLVEAGDVVRVKGWLDPPDEVQNPGGFSGRVWARSASLLGTLRVEEPSLLRRAAPDGLVSWLESVRVKLRAWLARSLRAALPEWTPPEAEDLAVAMTLGVRGDSIAAVRGLFSRVGLSHFIAISGFNLAVLFAAALCVASSLGAGGRLQGSVLILVSLAFLLVLDAEVSIVRAGIAGLVAGASLLLGRAWPRMSAFSLVVLVVVVTDPGCVQEPAFQLSFGAVAGLLLLADPLCQALGRVLERAAVMTAPTAALERPLRRALLARMAGRTMGTSVTAWIVATPIAAWNFGSVAPYAAFWSILLAPLASLLAVLGPLTAVAGWLLPGVVGWPLSLGTTAFLRTVEWGARLPGSTLRLEPPPSWWLLITPTAAAVALLLGRPPEERRGRGAHRSTRARAAGAPETDAELWRRRAVRATWAAWAALMAYPFLPGAAEPFQVVTLAMGEGACHLIRAGHSNVLIDAGSLGRPHAGSTTIVPALAALGVRKLDAVVLTQGALRHVSGAAEVVEALPVALLLVPPGSLNASPLAPIQGALRAAAREGVQVEEMVAPAVAEAGELSIRCLHPATRERWEDRRDGGLVVRVEDPEGASALFLSELADPGLRALAAATPVAPAGAFGTGPDRAAGSGRGRESPLHEANGDGDPLRSLVAVVPVHSRGLDSLPALLTRIRPEAILGGSHRHRDASRPAWVSVAHRVRVEGVTGLRWERWGRLGWSALDGGSGGGAGGGGDGGSTGGGGAGGRQEEGPAQEHAVLDRAIPAVQDLHLQRGRDHVQGEVQRRVGCVHGGAEELAAATADDHHGIAQLPPVPREFERGAEPGGCAHGGQEEPGTIEGHGRRGERPGAAIQRFQLHVRGARGPPTRPAQDLSGREGVAPTA